MNHSINDLPKDVQDEIRKKIYNTEKYRELSNVRNAYIATGNYMKAMQMYEKMKHLEDVCAQAYVKVYCQEAEKLTTLVQSMSEEAQLKMNTLGNLLTMLADMLDTAVMDTNQLINKYHPGFHIDMFDKLQALGLEAKRHVRMFDNARPGKYFNDLFGDTSDNLYEMSYNKVKSFIIKLRKYEERINKKAAHDAEVA